MSFAQAERARLRDLLLASGPESATLCEGWNTRDLVAHLWLREHRLDALAGKLLTPLAGHTRSVVEDLHRRPYEELVRAWGAGGTGWNPLRFNWLDRLLNTAENFIHYEDVRRGPAWQAGEELPAARDFSHRVDDELAKSLSLFAKLLLRRSARPVLLIAPGRRPIQAAGRRGVTEAGDAVSRVYGPVGELLLWVTGRDAAHVAEQNPGWVRRGPL